MLGHKVNAEFKDSWRRALLNIAAQKFLEPRSLNTSTRHLIGGVAYPEALGQHL